MRQDNPSTIITTPNPVKTAGVRPLWTMDYLKSADANTSSLSREIPFNTLASTLYSYHTNQRTSFSRVEETFGQCLPRLDSGLILDGGCSKGHTPAELSGQYPNSIIIGIDINETRLRIAELNNAKLIESGHVRILGADAYNLSVSFDHSVRFEAIFLMNNILFASLEMEEAHIKAVVDQTIPFLQYGGYLLMSGDGAFIILKKMGSILHPCMVQTELAENGVDLNDVSLQINQLHSILKLGDWVEVDYISDSNI